MKCQVQHLGRLIYPFYLSLFSLSSFFVLVSLQMAMAMYPGGNDPLSPLHLSVHLPDLQCLKGNYLVSTSPHVAP